MQNQWKSTWVGASWAMLAQDDTSLKPCWRKMTERIDFSLIFGTILGYQNDTKNRWTNEVIFRHPKKLCSQYNIATDRKFRECNIFRCEICEKWCFGTYQTDPECFLGAILAQDSPERRFVMIFRNLGYHFGNRKWYKNRSRNQNIFRHPSKFCFYDRRPQKHQNEVPKLP